MRTTNPPNRSSNSFWEIGLEIYQKFRWIFKNGATFGDLFFGKFESKM